MKRHRASAATPFVQLREPLDFLEKRYVVKPPRHRAQPRTSLRKIGAVVGTVVGAAVVIVAVLLLTGTIGADLRRMPPAFYLAAGRGRLFMILGSLILAGGALILLRRQRRWSSITSRSDAT